MQHFYRYLYYLRALKTINIDDSKCHPIRNERQNQGLERLLSTSLNLRRWNRKVLLHEILFVRPNPLQKSKQIPNYNQVNNKMIISWTKEKGLRLEKENRCLP